MEKPKPFRIFLHMKTITPWGSWEILLETPFTKVKRLEVAPGPGTSYQTHSLRWETHTVVSGSGWIRLDGVDHPVAPSDSIRVPIGAAHSLRSATGMTVIEVQGGAGFEEGDIIRLEDPWRR